MRSTLKRHYGFTLVELLVVIGIISLLVGILLPSLAKARANAQEVQCASNLRQWGIGITMYADSNKGRMPIDGEDGQDAASSIQGPELPIGLGWESPAMWFNAIPPLLNGKSYNEMQLAHAAGTKRLPLEGENSIFVCPSTSTAINRTSSPGTNVNNGYFTMYARLGATPSVARDTFVCYALNSKMFEANPAGLPISRIRPASEFVMMVEKRMRGGEVSAADDAYYAAQGGPANRLTSRQLNRIKADWQRFTTRHRKGKGGNLLFADGHVSYSNHRDVITAGVVGPAGTMNRPGMFRWAFKDTDVTP